MTPGRPTIDPLGRRFALKRLSVLPLVFAALFPGAARPAQGDDPRLRGLMKRAMQMKQRAVAAGDQGFGAVVALQDRVVGESPSRVVTDHDPTAHAEMAAIRDAARRLGSARFGGCILVSTSKPCRMCETAAYWAGIDRFYYSAEIVDGGPPRYDSC